MVSFVTNFFLIFFASAKKPENLARKDDAKFLRRIFFKKKLLLLNFLKTVLVQKASHNAHKPLCFEMLLYCQHFYHNASYTNSCKGTRGNSYWRKNKNCLSLERLKTPKWLPTYHLNTLSRPSAIDSFECKNLISVLNDTSTTHWKKTTTFRVSNSFDKDKWQKDLNKLLLLLS